jgi:hypothetical protein
MAIDPRDELVLGGETRLIDVLYVLARPAAERVLLLVDRWYRSGGEASPSPGSLWKAPALPQLGGGIPSRDSLFAPVQLGRRFAPDVRTPFRLVRHLAGAGARAVELAGTLARPLSEQAPPARPLREAAGRHVSPGRRSVTV